MRTADFMQDWIQKTKPVMLMFFFGLSLLPAHSHASESQTPVQQSLTPSTILVQASVQNALVHLNGIRSQLKLMNDKPSSSMAHGLMVHLVLIRSELTSASKYEIELSKALARYPRLAMDEDFRSLSQAFAHLHRFQRQWMQRALNLRYWRNMEQVRSDLNILEQRLNEVLDKNQSFTSEKLDFSFVS